VPRAEPVTEAVVDAEPSACDRQQKAVANEPDSGGRIAPRSSRGRPDVNEVKAVLAGIWFVVVLTW